MRPGLQTLLAPLVLHLVLQLLKLVYLVQLVQYVLVQLVQAVPQPVLQPVLQMMLQLALQLLLLIVQSLVQIVQLVHLLLLVPLTQVVHFVMLARVIHDPFFETLHEQLQMLICAIRFDLQAELFDEAIIPQRQTHNDLATILS